MKTKKEQLKEFLEILFNCANEATENEQNNEVDKPETENESE